MRVVVHASGAAAQVARQVCLQGGRLSTEERRVANSLQLSCLRLEVLDSAQDTHVGD